MDNNQNTEDIGTSIDSTSSYETGVWNNLKLIFQQQVPLYFASVEQNGGSRSIKDINGLFSYLENTINNSLKTFIKQRISISRLKPIKGERIKADKQFKPTNQNPNDVPFEITNLQNNNESKNMNMKLIRLTESDLHRIVKESVEQILKESNYENYFDWAKRSNASDDEIEAAGERHDSRIPSIYEPDDYLAQRASDNERYKKQVEHGYITPQRMKELQKFNFKNHRSGGKLYTDRLMKALTPNPKWFKN